MKIRLGVVMDPIQQIHYKKDSTLAMLWEAAAREWEIHYFEQQDLFLRDGKAYGRSRVLRVFQHPEKWFDFGESRILPLTDLQGILMRKDPPFDREYIYTTYLLEQAERDGVPVFNKPQSLRDANEKVFTQLFPTCCPPTLVTRDITLLKDFFKTHQDIICKPLDAMGGYSVFHLKPNDQNASVVFEMLTQRGTCFTMAQKFIPEITKGDKRILLINGEPIPYALARIPAAGESRGNLAAGAKGIAQPLSERDRWICQQVGPTLREKGLSFVGLDVIGDFLTEINVTSPTGIRELEDQCGIKVAAQFIDFIAARMR